MDVGVLTFALAAAVHLSFQWVVAVVVYPGLADTARTAPAVAAALHGRYTSRMGVVVAPVYGLLIVGTVAVVADPPSGSAGEWLPWVAVTTSLATVLVTGLLAVPLHRALSGGHVSGGDVSGGASSGGALPGDTVSPERTAHFHARLRRVDHLRLGLATSQVAAAMIAVVAA